MKRGGQFYGHVNVELPNDAAGNISAYLDDDDSPFYNEEYHDYAEIYFNDVDLTFSNHTLKLNYTGDSNYAGFQKTYQFNATYDLVFDDDINCQFGEDVTIHVLVPDIEGNVTFLMNGKSYPFTIDEEPWLDYYSYRFASSDLNFGVNNFTITVSNDPVYPNKSFKGAVITYSYILIDYPNSKWGGNMIYGDEGNITLSLPGDAKGTLNVTIDGRQIADATSSDGKFYVPLPRLDVGKHTIIVNYTGSDYHVDAIENSDFSVVPFVIVPKYVYSQCENYTVTVKLDENASDILKIINIEKSEEIFSGKVNGTNTFNISSDILSIRVQYGEEYIKDFVIYKRDTNPVWAINITYDSEILKGDYLYIHGNFPVAAAMKYIIEVDGKKFVVKDYLEIGSSDLALGLHNFTIEAIDEDGYFITQKAPGSFNVTAVKFNFNDKFEHIFESNTWIYGYAGEGVTGNILLIIDGKDYVMQFIDDRNLYISIDDLACGQHDYEMIYSGNYPQQTQRGKFNVTYQFGIYMHDEYSYGEYIDIMPKLPFGATGTITLKIGNNTYTSPITYNYADNMEVNFNLPNLEVGEYNASFTYNGDGRLNYPQTVNKTFTVSGYRITSPEYSMNWNNDEYIAVMLPENATGNLIVTVDGNPYANVKVENGTAKISIKNLTLGKHNISAKYSGDDYSVEDLEITDFAVRASVEWSEQILISDCGWISVVLPDDAKGNITITFDWDDTTAINVTAGQLKNYTLDYKIFGEHYFNLEYFGDDYNIEFGDGWSYSHFFEVCPNKMVLPVDGGDEIILDLPEDAKGNLTVYYFDYSYGDYQLVAQVAVKGSRVNLSLAGLIKESYDLKMVYDDEKYGTYTYGFWGSPTNSPKIIITSTGNDKTAIINFELPRDADGSLIIKFNDKFYFKDLVGGKANLTVDGLASGNYLVEVTYSGGENYSATTASANITIPKPAPAKIVANDISAIYSAGTKYSITVYAEGGALAKNVEVIIKVNGKKVATVKTDANGVATYNIVQVPGSYKITVEALGVIVTKKLTVKHILKLQKVNVKRSAKKLVIKATLAKVNGKYLKGKKITLKFKGKKYTAKTNKKGVAKFTIKSKVLKKLKKGKKVKYQATYLKDIVKYTVKVKK